MKTNRPDIRRRSSRVGAGHEARTQQGNALFALIACLVVLATAFALMMPALSLTKDAADADTAEVQAQVEEASAEDAGAKDADGGSKADSGKDSADSEASADDDADQVSGGDSGNDEGAASPEPAGTSSDDGGSTAGRAEGAGSEADNTDDDSVAYPKATLEGVVDDDYAQVRVRVDVPKGALPEGTQLALQSVKPSKVSAAVKAAIAEDDANVQVKDVVAVDIAFVWDGWEIEPAKKVKVTIERLDDDVDAAHALEVVHVDDPDGLRIADAKASELKGKTLQADLVKSTQDGASVQFKSDDFSVYALAETTAKPKARVAAAASDDATGTITVKKDVEVQQGLEKSAVDTTVYFALTKDGEYDYLQKDGEVWMQSIRIVDGIAQGEAKFEGVPEGRYEVWELAYVNGQYVKQYNGLVLGEGFQISGIKATNNVDTGGNNAIITGTQPAAKVDFINTYSPKTETVEFVANKRWTNRQNADISAPEGAHIEFTLYREYSGKTEKVRSITLDGIQDVDGEASAWQAKFENLAKKAPDGSDYKYKVRETVSVPNFYPFKDQNTRMGDNDYMDNSGGTIINKQLLMNLTLIKHFDIQENKYSQAEWQEMLDSGRLHFTLTNNTTGQEWQYTLDNDSGFERDNQTFRLKLYDMPFGEYTFKEYGYRGLIKERKWTEEGSVTEYTRTQDIDISMTNPMMELQCENKYVMGEDTSDGIRVSAHKAWSDMDDIDGIRPTSVQVELYANGVRYEADGVQNPVTLDASNNWRYAWEELPETDASGNAIDYTVDEVTIPEGYAKSIEVSGNLYKSFEITNTHVPTGQGRLDLTKTVTGDAGDAAPKEVRVSVQNSEGKYLTAEGKFTDAETAITLPVGETKSYPVPVGTYTVLEKRESATIGGYTLSVSGEGDYLVTKGNVTAANIVNDYSEITEDGTIKVVKKWLDENGDEMDATSVADKTAQVTLKRKKAEGATGHKITVSITGAKYEYDSSGTGHLVEEEWISDVAYVSDGESLKVRWLYKYAGNLTVVSNGKAMGLVEDKEYAAVSLGEITSETIVSIRFMYKYGDTDFANQVKNAGIQFIYSNDAPASFNYIDDDSFVQTATLSAPSFTHSWTGLDKADGSGSPYLYYIEETTVPGFTTSVDHGGDNPIQSGVITVTNQRTPPTETLGNLAIDKTWLTSAGDAAQPSDVVDYLATFTVYKRQVSVDPGANWIVGADADGEWELVGDYTVGPSSSAGKASADSPAYEFDGWQVALKGLQKSLVYKDSPSDSKYWIYKVVETAVEQSGTSKDVSSFNPVYTTGDGTAAISNTLTSEYGVELPSTGGPGTLASTLVGVLMALLAGGFLVRRGRRICR